ncbi:MAG: T9SS type A sorting domain-containing protein [Psychromonas sp.]|nr:T9SS type A sorting domain-containing protein [Psychromonas sp.]
MKKDLLFSCFVLLIVICFSTTNIAQNNSSGTGQTPGSHQISKITRIKIPASLVTPCRYVYYYDATTSMIGRFSFDIGCPGGDLAFWTPPTFASGGVQGGNGNFYILDAGPSSSLCLMDTSNGDVTVLGQITGMGSASANGIAYDAVNDSYYLCGYSGSTNNLYKLDINTLTATLISSIGSPGSSMIAIAINSSGVGYGYELMPDNNAYTFDPVSGTSALLGPIGFNAQYGQDMDIDIESGIIYLAAFNSNTNIGEFRTMDPNTGMTTLLSPLLDQISVLEFDNEYNIIPVELISFTASVNQKNINLNWITSTETNNQGFEVQRKSCNREYEKIGFVAGCGTTTESHSYTFTDMNIPSGSYTYRLKQTDFDGSYKYSNEVSAEVGIPVEFELSQNYPNPFNPNTKISFSIPLSDFVTLKVYDVIGKEVTILVDEVKSAGYSAVEFDASSLPSGIYFYKIQAGSFTDIKKMVLLK